MQLSVIKLRRIGPALSALIGICAFASAAQAALVTFEDMPGTVLDDNQPFTQANGGFNTIYQGVTWDNRLNVFGSTYKVDEITPGAPFYGVPFGNYALTNSAGDDGILLTTDQVLTGVWFGQNEYYGFGAGADEVTVSALNGSNVLMSIVMGLPDNNPGLPEPLSFMDTSAFQSLSGITGYRIDRNPLGQFGGNWVADDFTFVAANPAVVPEPSTLLGTLLGGLCLGGVTLYQRRSRR